MSCAGHWIIFIYWIIYTVQYVCIYTTFLTRSAQRKFWAVSVHLVRVAEKKKVDFLSCPFFFTHFLWNMQNAAYQEKLVHLCLIRYYKSKPCRSKWLSFHHNLSCRLREWSSGCVISIVIGFFSEEVVRNDANREGRLNSWIISNLIVESVLRAIILY